MPFGVGNHSLPLGRVKAYDQRKGRPVERLHLAYLTMHSHVIARLPAALDRTQLRHKKNFDARLREKNINLIPGDWVFIRHQKVHGKKLKSPVKGQLSMVTGILSLCLTTSCSG